MNEFSKENFLSNEFFYFSVEESIYFRLASICLRDNFENFLSIEIFLHLYNIHQRFNYLFIL